MAYLFHLNMKNFAGPAGALATTNFQTAFTAMNGAPLPPAAGFVLPVGPPGPAMAGIVVAGFTELMNNAAAQGALNVIATPLTVGGVVSCGGTALRRGDEYIGIATAPAVSIRGWGRVFIGQGGGGAPLVHDVSPDNPPTAGWAFRPPAHLPISADYRGLVYVVVRLGGSGAARIVVGFIHNMCTFGENRAIVLQRIGDMVTCMRQHPKVRGRAVDAYIGGDFNMEPANRTSRQLPAGNRTVVAYASTVANRMSPPTPPGKPGTSWMGRLIDYWYVHRIAGPPPVGSRWPGAPIGDARPQNSGPGGVKRKNGGMSDHAAVMLQI